MAAAEFARVACRGDGEGTDCTFNKNIMSAKRKLKAMSTCQSLLAACQISRKSDRPRERHARAFDCSFVSPDRAMVDVDVARDGAAARANGEASSSSSSSSSSGGEEAVVVVDMASSLPSVLRGCACADGGRLLRDACHGARAASRRGRGAAAPPARSRRIGEPPPPRARCKFSRWVYLYVIDPVSSRPQVGSVALAALTVLLVAAFVLVAAATSAAVAAVVSWRRCPLSSPWRTSARCRSPSSSWRPRRRRLSSPSRSPLVHYITSRRP